MSGSQVQTPSPCWSVLEQNVNPDHLQGSNCVDNLDLTVQYFLPEGLRVKERRISLELIK